MADKRVKYWLNSKAFEDYGAYVSQSHGLIDIPERKPVLTHEWAEDDGIQMDLKEAPKYKARIISLDMFFRGDNWSSIKNNINTLLGELDNAGTQVLKVKPFDYDEMEFEVVQYGNVEINKVFNDGVMFAVLTLKLIEVNND